MLYSIVAMLVVILDQAVKFWVTDHLLGYDEITLIPGLINMVDVPNDGAAFGILSGGNARIGFIIITVVFCLAVIIALATNFINGRLARWSLVMVAAGGFANCIDRVMYGYVVDMFKMVPFPNFAIFNVADIFITVFCIIFALAIIFEKDKVDDEDEDDDEGDEEEDAEDDYEQPKPRKLKLRRKDEDDEEELAEKRPAKLSKKAKAQAKAEAEYEEYKAAQNQRLGRSTAAAETSATQKQTERQSSTPVQSAQKAQTNTSDNPFAEWEQANAKVDAKRSTSYAAQAMDSGVNTKQSRSVYHAPVQQSVQQPAEQNPQSVAQSAAPVTKAKSGSDDFDLDSILNEFK